MFSAANSARRSSSSASDVIAASAIAAAFVESLAMLRLEKPRSANTQSRSKRGSITEIVKTVTAKA
jgi:hypothetical protein